MALRFETTVGELWTALGLEPADIEGDSIELEADGLKVRLEEQADGSGLIATAEVGALAADLSARSEQIRRVLSANLGFVAARRACAHLLEDGSDPPVLAVSGRHSYNDDYSALSELLDDVVYLQQWHKDDSLGSAAARTGFKENLYERDDFIFRP